MGDQLLRVNQHDVRLATVSDTTHLLQSTGASVSLALAANPEGFAQYSQEVAAVSVS